MNLFKNFTTILKMLELNFKFYNLFCILCFSETRTDDDDLNKNSNFQLKGYDFVHQIKIIVEKLGKLHSKRIPFVINKEMILVLPYSGWAFSGLLTDGGSFCHTYPTMMKLGTVIP